MADPQQQSEALKKQGNDAVAAGKLDDAIKFYTEAINLNTTSNLHVLYSNRSAAYAKANRYAKALEDADEVIEKKPDWPKGYARKGDALSFMDRYEEAMMSYQDGLKHDPDNSKLLQGVADAKKHLTGPAGSQPLSNPFGDPELFKKLGNDSRTKKFLDDPGYVDTMKRLQADPSALATCLQDNRVLTSLSVLMGVNLQVVNDTGSGDLPDLSHLDKPMEQDDPAPPSKPQEKKKEKEEAMEVEQSENQKKALDEKTKGNEAYKKKDFVTAISHYEKAFELDPTNMTFLTNKAAVFYEQGEFDQCIKECEKAIQLGREQRSDFKIIAKAFTRIGNSYMKKDDLEKAIQFFNKSLSEHRAQDVVKKVQAATKTLKERERLALLDPEKALDEKKKGNEAFQKGDYPNAIKFYSQSLLRNPDDAKVYSNRAACYTKLAEFTLAIKDCDECIRLDPTFVKGYLRKGASLMAMKNTTEAARAYQKATDLDPNCAEAIEGYRKCVMLDSDPEVVRKRAMENPEVQAILADPAMQMILQQMQKDPNALKEHLKNPDIAAKIEKLMSSGLIQIR